MKMKFQFTVTVEADVPDGDDLYGHLIEVSSNVERSFSMDPNPFGGASTAEEAQAYVDSLTDQEIDALEDKAPDPAIGDALLITAVRALQAHVDPLLDSPSRVEVGPDFTVPGQN